MSQPSHPAPHANPDAAPDAFRFVHCSDVHLDSPFRCASDDVRARLHDAGRAAFRRLVDLCLAEKVHALLVAGDLYDDDRLTFTTEEFLLEQFERLCGAGIHVVVACGNHDHGHAEGRAARMHWPASRFTLFAGHDPAEVTITAADGTPVARVVGCGHADDRDGENLAAQFPAASGALPVVGLLHARVAGASGAERHPDLAPCTTADLAAAGYRYWALGHVHVRQELRDGGRSAPLLGCYPGSLIGHRSDETAAHGALLVTVPRTGAVKTEFHPVAGVRWETLDVPGLAQVADLDALRASVRESFHRAAAAAHAAGQDVADAGALRWMLRVELSGPCPAAVELQRDELVEELAEQLTAELLAEGVLGVELVEAGVHRPVSLDGHRGQPHVLGLSLEVLDTLAGDEELLARLAPAALAGCDGLDASVKRDYLRSLLTGIDSAAGQALLKETLA
jgi:DNA repair protein SbcD/Mre11